MVYLKYWKVALFALILLALGVQTYRIALWQSDYKKLMSNCTTQENEISLLLASEKNKDTSLAALQAQVEASIANCEAYQANQKKINAVYHGPKPTTGVTKKEVMSDEASSDAINLLNDMLDSVQ